MTAPIRVPERLVEACRRTPERGAWLDRLPVTVEELVRRWSLTIGPPLDGATAAWVAPATRVDGTSAVLKVGMPHAEGEHEIDGLRILDGDPTVLLLDADEELGAMLLERCEPGTPLSTLPEPEQDVVVARLLRRLWRPLAPGHGFRPLAAMTDHWAEETRARSHAWVDPALVREGLRLFAELPDSAPDEVLLATDLHAGNVLRAQREPWLVIDPKPYVGDPAYDATQHLFNCPGRLASDAHGTIGRFAGLLDVDPDRIRRWVFARAAAGPRPGDRDWSWLARVLATPP